MKIFEQFGLNAYMVYMLVYDDVDYSVVILYS